MSDEYVGELARLKKVYGDMGDGQLLALAKEPASLTDVARTALRAELDARGLGVPAAGAESDILTRSNLGVAVHEPEAGDGRADAFGMGVPGIVPGAGPAVEQALEPVGATHAGMAQLWSSYDGIELSTACAALEAAGIPPALEEVTGDEGRPNFFKIWVTASDLEAAKATLRTKVGLFPELEPAELAEYDGEVEQESAGDDMVVAEFETADEAEELRVALSAAGIPSTLLAEEEMAALAVAPAYYDAALALLAERLGVAE